MTAEVNFEYLALALETTRGQAPNDPTHYINLKGMITPTTSEYAPDDSDGTLAARSRSVITRRWSVIEGEGGLDVVIAPLIANMVLMALATPQTTPAGASTARDWAFTRAMTTNTLKTGAFFWGDPNTGIFRAAFGIVKEWVIEADATGEDGTSMNINGVGASPVRNGEITNATQANPVVITSAGHGLENGDNVTISGVVGMTELNGNSYQVANKTDTTFELDSTDGTGFTAYTSGGVWDFDAPTLPTQVIGGLIVPSDIQVWIDTASGIGTTEITDGRVLKVTHTIPSGLVEKFRPGGLQSRRTINGVGVSKVNPVTELTIELFDFDQYSYFRNDTVVKVRVRHNGAEIETVSGTTFYEKVECDTYGPMRDLAWGEYEGTNRTMEVTIPGQKDATLGSDFKMTVRNARTAL